MSESIVDSPFVATVDVRDVPPLQAPRETNSALMRMLVVLAAPVFAEHVLHILVGWNDTYLANHIHQYDVATAVTRADEVAAGAAVGTMSFILWFVSLVISSIGTGSTAIIARAIGARHRRLANSICGQSISAAIIVGLVCGVGMYFLAAPIARLTGLEPAAAEYAASYMRILALSTPFSLVMFVANPCLRGAGDTLTPAITMIVVDVINMGFSFGLTYGWFGMPRLGFNGIAWGTAIAYVAGGVIQFGVLVSGRGGIRLFLHRLRPHWHNLKRLLRIGLPGGAADMFQWAGNFVVVYCINTIGAAEGNAHNIAIRIESISFMTGFAVATAAATMVGQSLGMGKPDRARRSAYLSYALGGGIMTFAGICFILFGKYPAMLFSEDPEVRALVVRCLATTGFIQSGFAAAMCFGGALRGAGDTMAVMLLSSSSILIVRVIGTFLIARVFHMGLGIVWIALCADLFLRGVLMYMRFVRGTWMTVKI